jgi:hypothetical protein
MTADEPAGIGHVAILGLGPSLEHYLDRTKRLGGRRQMADQVWAINALGDILQCDLTFHMDDIRVQEIRAAARPDGNIAAMVAWLRHHPGRVITSRAHPAYPCLEEFPLQAVINDLGSHYFNSTVAYAVAYAIHRRASEISLFGCDFTYANAHHAEQGRACVEYWLGIATARGIVIGLPAETALMDACEQPAKGLYGYDTVELRKSIDADGVLRVEMVPHDRLPTAEEIEGRYDHGQHPSALVRAAGAQPEGDDR